MIINPREIDGERVVLLLDAGHGEYRLSEGVGDAIITYFHVDHDDPTPEELVEFEQMFRLLADSPNNWLSQDEWEGQDTWTTIVRIGGDFRCLMDVFKLLAASLMPSLDPAGYTPGGDDDHYDYYPSGMRMLREMAYDLQALAKQQDTDFYTNPGPVGVYFAVVADYLRREARRWEPNWITCATVGYDDFFTSEEVETYVVQACGHLAIPNNPGGWETLAQTFGLSSNAFVRWANPRPGDHVSPNFEIKYTSEQPYRKETHA